MDDWENLFSHSQEKLPLKKRKGYICAGRGMHIFVWRCKKNLRQKGFWMSKEERKHFLPPFFSKQYKKVQVSMKIATTSRVRNVPSYLDCGLCVSLLSAANQTLASTHFIYKVHFAEEDWKEGFGHSHKEQHQFLSNAKANDSSKSSSSKARNLRAWEENKSCQEVSLSLSFKHANIHSLGASSLYVYSDDNFSCVCAHALACMPASLVAAISPFVGLGLSLYIVGKSQQPGNCSGEKNEKWSGAKEIWREGNLFFNRPQRYRPHKFKFSIIIFLFDKIWR